MDKWFRLYKAAVAYNLFQESCVYDIMLLSKHNVSEETLNGAHAVVEEMKIIKDKREWKLDFGLFVNINQNQYGQTILHHVYRSAPAVKWILHNMPSINVNAKNANNGRTALCNAAWYDTKSVRYLLEYENIDINVPDNLGYTALHWSCQFNTDIAKMLLSRPDIRDGRTLYGHSALDFAKAINLELVEWFVKYGLA